MNMQLGDKGIEWTDIPDCDGYFASRQGRILSARRGAARILAPVICGDGYESVFIFGTRRRVHRLILETFVGPCPDGMECRHLDGSRGNNCVDNLRWGTRLQNVADRRRHGRMPIPHESRFTKLTPDDIPHIRALALSGLSSRQIGAQYRTSHTTIQKIVRGERWKGY